MTYQTGDIASLRFLAANCVYQLTGTLLGGDEDSDRGALDDAVLLMDVISSYHTESDPKYLQEMATIAKERKTALAQVPRGMELDPAVTEAFRWAELKAAFRSLCRQGTFVRQDSPKAEWVPGGA